MSLENGGKVVVVYYCVIKSWSYDLNLVKMVCYKKNDNDKKWTLLLYF